MHWGVKKHNSKDPNKWFLPKKFRVHNETEISKIDFESLDTRIEVNSQEYAFITGN